VEKSRSMGAAEGSIMAAIMTAHMLAVVVTSAIPQGAARGIAIP
jgi:hypothetical protein